jgi:hypothetical protein
VPWSLLRGVDSAGSAQPDLIDRSSFSTRRRDLESRRRTARLVSNLGLRRPLPRQKDRFVIFLVEFIPFA